MRHIINYQRSTLALNLLSIIFLLWLVPPVSVYATNSVPVADFSGGPTGGCNQLSVNFTDLTTGGDGPLSYYWEFGIGGYNTVYSYPTSSTAQNPTVYFEHYSGTNPNGYASVRLTVTDADGDVDVMEKANYIRVDRHGGPGGCSGNVIANFSASPTTGDAPLTVNFTNTTTLYTPPFSYEWDFDNDGVVDSTETNPSYTYNSVGTYTVKLKATDPYGRTGTKVRTDYIFVKIGSVPVADFSGTPTSGSNPLTVNFTNATTGGDAPLSYEWDFDNDGVVDSTDANPSHIYTSSGYFTVKLKATDVHGDTHTVTKQNFIFVTTNSVPVADFSGGPTGGCNQLTVNFTDLTTGGDGPLSYYWEFGIGGYTVYSYPTSSTAQNPTVYFEHYSGTNPNGYASVRLTVTDADGDVDVMEKANYIRVDRHGGPGGCSGNVIANFSASPTTGDAPLTVNFTNTTTLYTPPFSYEWDFDNDGVVDSTETNPSYTYNSVGTYTVKLKATDPYGRTGTKVWTDYISVTMFTGDIAAGHDHTLYTKPDGTLWAWGLNDSGQLGDGTTTNRLNPVQIGSDADWKAVSAGWKHSIAIKRDGTLWTWGNNDYGQLGDGSTTERHVPIQIGSGNDWHAISTGGAHNLALKSNRTLWAWGLNSVGQIGDGTSTTRLSPLQIGSNTDWKAIAAGWEHSAAIRSDKSLYTWGWNNEGQLGNGTRTDSYSPVKIGSNEWSDVSAGWQHTIAIKDDGLLWAWGDNDYAQLGDGTTTDRLIPVQIGGNSVWLYISAGGAHNLAVKSDGTIWAWGGNWQGQIGDGTTTIRTSPGQIGSDSDWTVVSAGWEHSAALISDASILTWGWNAYGQLGNGLTEDGYSPGGIDYIPTAHFTAFPLDGIYPLTVNFTNQSTGGDGVLSYEWDFNNDEVADSAEENPSYNFNTAGTYSVKLTVMDSDGDTHSVTRTNYITVTCPNVRIEGPPPLYLSMLSDAYNVASSGDTIQSMAMSFYGNLSVNKTVSFTGGYNCTYSSVTGKTVVVGNVMISGGTVNMENFVISASP